MSELEWALAAGILLAGGFIQGSIGIGLPIFTVPLLSTFIGPREAVVMMSFSLLLTNLANVRLGLAEWRNLRRVIPYFLTAVATVPLGVLFLRRGDPEVVRLLIGLAVCAFLATRRFVPSMGALRPAVQGGVGAGLGVVAGFLAGMASIPGPVSIVYFSMFRWKKDAFIFMINAFNSITVMGLVGTLALKGEYTRPALLRAVGVLLPVFVGFWVGLRARERLRQEAFFGIVHVGLGVIAASLIVRAAWHLFL